MNTELRSNLLRYLRFFIRLVCVAVIIALVVLVRIVFHIYKNLQFVQSNAE